MTEREQQYFEVMLEQILHEVKTIAERHSALDDKMERYHSESKSDHKLSMDLIKHSHEVLKEEIQGVRTDLKVEIQGVRTELKEEIRAVDRKLTAEIRAVDRKLTAEIRAVGAKVEGHEDRIRFLERKVA
jgi:hypothetical protein